jgi:hypothetical protein
MLFSGLVLGVLLVLQPLATAILSGAILAMLAPYASWVRQGALAVASALAGSMLQFLLALIVAAMFWGSGKVMTAILRDVMRRLGGVAAVAALEAAGASLRSVAYGVVLAISQIGAVLIPLVWAGGAWWLFQRGADGWGFFIILWGACWFRRVTTSSARCSSSVGLQCR